MTTATRTQPKPATVRYLAERGIEVKYTREGQPIVKDTCPRCGGTGEYGPRVVKAGQCFECMDRYGMGVGYKYVDADKWVRREKGRNYRERKRQEAAEALVREEQAQRDRNGGKTDSELAIIERDHAIALKWDAKRDETAARKALSQYVGTPGDKIELDVEVKGVWSFQSKFSYYGRTYINKMVDADGNVIVWKTSSTSLEEGAKIRIKATVKEHSEYRGEKQTVVLRLKEIDA